MARKQAVKAAAKRRNPNPYQRAKRRRSSAKRLRKFEAMMPRVSLPMPDLSMVWPRWSLRPLPGIVGSGLHWCKLLSLSLLAGVIAMIVWIQIDILWYVYSDSVFFTELTYLKAEELYPATELEAWNVFWVEPQTVRKRIMAHPYVVDADVQVRLPNQVVVAVEEAEATAVWVSDAGTLWVLEKWSGAADAST